MTFARELRDGSAFALRAFLADKDAVTLVSDLLALDDEGLCAVVSRAPMKHAQLAGLQRNARVVLENASDR